MANSNKAQSKASSEWKEHLGTAAKVATFLASVVAVVNGIDTYNHHHPNGWNNHNDWKG